MQKAEIECKKLKLSGESWNKIDQQESRGSTNKQNGGQVRRKQQDIVWSYTGLQI